MNSPSFLGRCFPALLAAALVRYSHGQDASTATGGLFGQITEADTDAELADVKVTVSETSFSATSGSDGRYSILEIPPGLYDVQYYRSGWEKQQSSGVEIKSGESTRLDVGLRLDTYELAPIEVVGDPLADFDAELLIQRQKDPSIKNAIGADMISRLSLSDAAEAVGKVTGASIADGKYAVIRGLADRYTFTTLNGTDLPSADPDRKAFQLDLLPSGFIQQVDVAKTFTPDMGGGFAGGAINIIPKSYPEEEFFSFKTGLSYNTNASMRDDFLVNDRGSTDWLAMDDGTRGLPSEVAEQPTRGPLDQSIASSFESDHFTPREGNSYVGSSYSLTYGNSHELFSGRAGYLLSISYKNDYKFYDDAKVNNYESFIFSPDGINQTAEKSGQKAVAEYTWAALANLGYEINDYHDLGLTIMHVQTAEDEAIIFQGFEDNVVFTDGQYLDQRIMHWTERKLDYMQLRGGHEIPDFNDIRFDWAGSLSSTTQDEPDHRVFQFVATPSTPSYVLRGPLKPQLPVRFWREVLEDNQSARADLTVPLPSYNEKDNLFKTGGALSRSERDFSQRALQVSTLPGHPFLRSGDPNDLIAPENAEFTRYENFGANVTYQGEQKIDAYYGMAEWAAFNWLKLVGGARVEKTEITLNGFNSTLGQEITPASIDETDVLPSLSGTALIRENLQLRAAWSETVIRPTYREIGDVELYDVTRTRVFIGNPDLEPVSQRKTLTCASIGSRETAKSYRFRCFTRTSPPPSNKVLHFLIIQRLLSRTSRMRRSWELSSRQGFDSIASGKHLVL